MTDFEKKLEESVSAFIAQEEVKPICKLYAHWGYSQAQEEIKRLEIELADTRARSAVENKLLKAENARLREALEFYSNSKDWFDVIATTDFGDYIKDGDLFQGFIKGEDFPWCIASKALKGGE